MSSLPSTGGRHRRRHQQPSLPSRKSRKGKSSKSAHENKTSTRRRTSSTTLPHSLPLPTTTTSTTTTTTTKRRPLSSSSSHVPYVSVDKDVHRISRHKRRQELDEFRWEEEEEEKRKDPCCFSRRTCTPRICFSNLRSAQFQFSFPWSSTTTTTSSAAAIKDILTTWRFGITTASTDLLFSSSSSSPPSAATRETTPTTFPSETQQPVPFVSRFRLDEPRLAYPTRGVALSPSQDAVEIRESGIYRFHYHFALFFDIGEESRDIPITVTLHIGNEVPPSGTWLGYAYLIRPPAQNRPQVVNPSIDTEWPIDVISRDSPVRVFLTLEVVGAPATGTYRRPGTLQSAFEIIYVRPLSS